MGARRRTKGDAKVLEPEFFKFIYKSLNVTFKEFSAKVNQKSEFEVRELQVCQELFFVNESKGLDRLQFDQNLPSDNKIRPKTLIETLPAKVNRNGLMPFDRKSALFESVCEQNLVNRFQ